MAVLAVVVLAAAGVLFIVKKREVTRVQKSAIRARLPDGCAVAEGIFLLVLAAVVALVHWLA